MEANQIGLVAAAWVRYQVAPSEDEWWAVEQVMELVEVDIATAWEVVTALCDAASEPETLCDIGAGPLENMIRSYGVDALRLLDSASDEKLLEAACCVWLTDPELEQQLDSLLSTHGRQRH
jgi:hypothetical protein